MSSTQTGSTPTTTTSRPFRIAIGVALAANLLDLTTSMIDSPADHLWPIPDKPTWLVALQCLLLGPLWVLAYRARGRIARAVRALEVPRPAMVVLGAYVMIACVHVALRAERYPFSPGHDVLERSAGAERRAVRQ